MNDCLFCKIAAGEIPSTRVWEDDLCVAFLDIAPVVPGHALVVPKAHHRAFTETPDDLLAHLVSVARRIAAAQKSVLGASGVNLISNDGESAGQTVPHLHVHVIPQYPDDRHVWNWEGRPYPDSSVPAGLAARLSAALR